MARTNAVNFSGALQFPMASTATDVFHKEDVQTLAQAVDQHDHTAGKGHSVNTTPANASITNAMLASDVARANLLTNGGFEIWQRGNGPFTANGAFSADRWRANLSGSDTLSVSPTTANTDTGSVRAAQCVCVKSGGTNTVLYNECYTATDGFQLVARQVSASVRVRTSTANAVKLRLSLPGTGGGVVDSAYHSGGGGWETLTATGLVPPDAAKVEVDIFFNASCTAYLDNAMLVVGSQAADYAPLHPADDLARCLRYYETIGAIGNSDVMVSGIATAGAQAVYIPYVLRAPKAVAPTVTVVGTWSNSNCAQPTVNANTAYIVRLTTTSSAAGVFYSQPSGAGQGVTVEGNP